MTMGGRTAVCDCTMDPGIGITCLEVRAKGEPEFHLCHACLSMVADRHRAIVERLAAWRGRSVARADCESLNAIIIDALRALKA